jgi:hypothetical protein
MNQCNHAFASSTKYKQNFKGVHLGLGDLYSTSRKFSLLTSLSIGPLQLNPNGTKEKS